MAELKIERQLKAPIKKVFDFVTKVEFQVKWWGPGTMSLPDQSLDMTAPGPWHCVMMNDEGQRYKVSGQVTKVEPPHKLGFTWAWHDDADKRGDESHVMISLSDNGDGTTAFTLHHMQLATEELAANHNQGWTSSVAKLEALANIN